MEKKNIEITCSALILEIGQANPPNKRLCSFHLPVEQLAPLSPLFMSFHQLRGRVLGLKFNRHVLGAEPTTFVHNTDVERRIIADHIDGVVETTVLLAVRVGPFLQLVKIRDFRDVNLTERLDRVVLAPRRFGCI